MIQTLPNSLSFPFADVPAPAQTIEVAPGIFWIRMPLPFALNHINLWLLRDGDGWTLVDCGFGIDATLSLWEQIFATLLDGKKIHRIIVTHYHPDHVGCAGWLQQRWNCEVWMTETEFLAAHSAVQDGAGEFRRSRYGIISPPRLDRRTITVQRGAQKQLQERRTLVASRVPPHSRRR